MFLSYRIYGFSLQEVFPYRHAFDCLYSLIGLLVLDEVPILKCAINGLNLNLFKIILNVLNVSFKYDGFI